MQGCRGGGPAATYFFQVQHGYFSLSAVNIGFDKNMLAVAAAVLPASLMNRDKHLRNVLQQPGRACCFRVGMLLIPFIQADKAFKLFGDHQRTPMVRQFLCITINQFWSPHSKLIKSPDCLLFAKHRGPAQRMAQRAITVVDLPLDVQAGLPWLCSGNKLHATAAFTSLVGFFHPLALHVPPVSKVFDWLSHGYPLFRITQLHNYSRPAKKRTILAIRFLSAGVSCCRCT